MLLSVPDDDDAIGCFSKWPKHDVNCITPKNILANTPAFKKIVIFEKTNATKQVQSESVLQADAVRNAAKYEFVAPLLFETINENNKNSKYKNNIPATEVITRGPFVAI